MIHGASIQESTDRPSPARMLLRGARKRCAACGSGKLFSGWFRMVERCPRCGYQFEREEGFFLGAYVMNLGITQVLLLVAFVPTIVLLNSNPGAGLAPFIVGGMLVAIAAPVLFYPSSKALWVAVELSLRLDEGDERFDDPTRFGPGTVPGGRA